MRRLSMLPPPAMLLPNAPWMCRSPATPPPVTAGKETGTEDHDKKKREKNAQSCHFSPERAEVRRQGLLSFAGSRSRWAGTCCDGGHHVRA